VTDVTLIVVDDEPSILFNIKEYFTSSTVVTFTDPHNAETWMQQNSCDIIIVDYRMPGLTGLELLQRLSGNHRWEYSILLTAFADKDMLEEAINRNLVDKVLEKPVLMKALAGVLEDACRIFMDRRKKRAEQELLAERYEDLQARLKSGAKLIGLDRGLKEVSDKISSVSKHNIGVLLTGETGTGKELVAETIHLNSDRADGPFIKINCAAIPDSLIESELFGYIKGTFTDARKDKPGKLELADGGTLFLDEIGELKSTIQVKLLRVLQDHHVERLGSTGGTDVDFRLIAATNRDLQQAVREGTFREDLYYRINTFPVELPPLRDRLVDIPSLASYFIDKAAVDMKIENKKITENALATLQEYSWPGNVRELENAIYRGLILAGNSRLLEPSHFAFLETIPEAGSPKSATGMYAHLAGQCISGETDLKTIKKRILEEIVRQCGNSIVQATEKTGISKDVFYRNR
jgi:DNA-binding NtrC family response regulator